MSRPSRCLLLASMIAALAPASAAGQRVLTGLRALPPEVSEAWAAPLAGALGPALTPGFFTAGRPPRGLSWGLRLSVGRAPAEDETFAPPLPGSVSFGGSTFQDPYVLEGGPTSPTVAGEGDGAVLVPRPGSDFEAALLDAGEDPATHRIPLPDGLNLGHVPVPSVEVSLGVGTLLGLTGRFFPRVELDDDLGDVGGFGAGALLSLDRFIPIPLVEAGLTAAVQQIGIGGYLDASATAVGVLASTGSEPARIYAHGQFVEQEVELAWRIRNPQRIAGLPADNSRQEVRYAPDREVRLSLGAALDLPSFHLSGEFSPGTPRVLSLRVGLGLQ